MADAKSHPLFAGKDQVFKDCRLRAGRGFEDVVAIIGKASQFRNHRSTQSQRSEGNLAHNSSQNRSSSPVLTVPKILNAVIPECWFVRAYRRRSHEKYSSF